MLRLQQPLFAILAGATDPQLRQMVEYLKAENRILRDKLPARLTVTPSERTRLVKLGTALGTGLKDLITIVSPRTFARWAAGTDGTGAKTAPARKSGRPRTPDQIRELVLKIAGANAWGSMRVFGELKKLGVRNVTGAERRDANRRVEPLGRPPDHRSR